jgi:hypothetical protein
MKDMKNIFLTIFLFTYLFSSVGHTAALHFCEMKMQVVDKSASDLCCTESDSKSMEEQSCCMVDEETKAEPLDCCSSSVVEKTEHINVTESGIESNCCKEIEIYKIVDNSLKNLETKVETVQPSVKIVLFKEIKSTKKVLVQNNYNPSIDHLNSPLLI